MCIINSTVVPTTLSLMSSMDLREKEVVVTLGKRKRIVSFRSEASQSDKAVLTKRITKEFRDRIKDDRCEIVLQMKNDEVHDFIEVDNKDVIDNKSVLEFFTEQTEVRLIRFLCRNESFFYSRH